MVRFGRAPALLLVVILALATAWATAAGLRAARDLWHEPDWPAATAEVIGVVPASADGFHLRVRFAAQGGAPVMAETVDLIGESQLALLRDSATAARTPTALVYYRPDRPADVRLTRQSGGARYLAAVYGLLALAAGGVSLAAFRRAAGLMLRPAESRP